MNDVSRHGEGISTHVLPDDWLADADELRDAMVIFRVPKRCSLSGAENIFLRNVRGEAQNWNWNPGKSLSADALELSFGRLH